MFIKSLFKQWPFMFYLVLSFIVLQVFFMFKAVETIPFFLYHMYSGRTKDPDTTYRSTIYINGRHFDHSVLSARERENLFGAFSYFRKLKRQDFYATDPAAIEKRFKGRLPDAGYGTVYDRLTNRDVNDAVFLDWWSRYLSRVSGKKVDSFSIVRSTVLWKPHYLPLNDTVSLVQYGGTQ